MGAVIAGLGAPLDPLGYMIVQTFITQLRETAEKLGAGIRAAISRRPTKPHYHRC